LKKQPLIDHLFYSAKDQKTACSAERYYYAPSYACIVYNAKVNTTVNPWRACAGGLRYLHLCTCLSITTTGGHIYFYAQTKVWTALRQYSFFSFNMRILTKLLHSEVNASFAYRDSLW